jgi:adenine-specific DNA-methyltransferase
MLDVLTRTRLLEVARACEMSGLTGKSRDEIVSTILRSRSVGSADLLRLLSRDELKAACRAVGLDDGGREKTLLAHRLLNADRAGASGGGGRDIEADRVAEKLRGRRMARGGRQSGNPTGHVGDYRHDEPKRKNNPEVGLANWEPKAKTPPTVKYEYDPFLDPQLQWGGKAERLSFDVDTVSLHIHERVSTQAIVKAVKKNGEKKGAVQQTLFDLFADPQLPLDQAVEFYQHDMDWANRLILGDSLLVMNSLLQRELMAGRVQMIYVDPPYGVNYKSNFQPTTRKPDPSVQDKDENLTREPEQIKAYRDTWTLGVHSYLTYLRDRLLLCRELLAEAGSIFVQISDENLHHVRELLDEVFGAPNFVQVIAFKKKKMPLRETFLAGVADYILWYAKNRDSAKAKFRRLFVDTPSGEESDFNYVELEDGERITISEGVQRFGSVPPGARYFQSMDMRSSGRTESCVFPFTFNGQTFVPGGGKSWKTNSAGMERLRKAGRLFSPKDTLRYVLFHDDYPVSELTHMWMDTQGAQDMRYVVETSTKVIQRCMLMTTDPGDLVFDPTCGSGTTAYVAEQWGRRWITCDTSRVALALARQRLLTATFDYYQLAHPEQRVDAGFVYQTVRHITLGSIAQNPKLDEVSDKDPRRREKIERMIAEGADHETVYDKPVVERGKVRVSGPFTVESIPVPSIEDRSSSPIEQWETLDPETRDDDIARRGRGEAAGDAGTNFILDMIEALKKAGINRLGGGTVRFTKLNAVRFAGVIQAEGELEGKNGNGGKHFAVSFGPRYGPVTLRQVEEAVNGARGRYDGVVLVGFTFDAPAQEFLKRKLPIEVMGAYINPDVLVGDLLKTSRASQIFTLFGQADIGVKKTKEGHVVEVRGVDLYDPQTGEVHSDRGKEIAAWFLDTDYDDRCFNICQAFFPGGGKNAWEKLARALRGTINEEAFEDLQGLTSIPFTPGKKIAVKVIDHRGNEMLEVFELQADSK